MVDGTTEIAELRAEQRRLRFELARSEAGSRYLAEMLPVLVCYVEASGRHVWANTAYEAAFGVTHGDAGTLNVREVLGEEGYEAIRPFIEGVLSGERQQFEIDLRDRASARRRIRGTFVPNRNENGDVTGYVGLMEDQTARAAQEDALRASEGRLQLLADAGAAASAGTDVDDISKAVARSVVAEFADLCIVDLIHGTDVRRVAVEGSGLIEGDVLEKLYGFFPNMSDRSDPAVRAFSGRPPVLFTDDLKDTLGHARSEEHQKLINRLHVRSTILVRLEHEGVKHGVMAICRVRRDSPFTADDRGTAADLGQRVAARLTAVKLTEELQSANEIKDQVLGLVSHELRTPLTTLKGNASVLRRRGSSLDAETLASVATDIERDAERLHSIVENMLVLARIEGRGDVEMEPLLLRRVAHSAVNEHLQRFPGVDIRVEATKEVLPVLGHETYLRQVITNLLTNATKYSPPGSPIHVSIERRGDEAVLSVADRGFGIPEEALSKVFEPFYRADQHARVISGVGLGLAVCKRLIEEQGGRIWAEGREGGGTLFGCAFPIMSSDE